MQQEFKINKERLTQVCLRLSKAFINKEKIFAIKREEVLPQFNLPEGIETQKEAAGYLFILASMERKSLTKVNIRNGRKTWENPQTKWIFEPWQTSQKSIDEIASVCKNNLKYMLNNFPQNYQNNSKLLLKKYDGDSRNIVHKQSIEQARKNLMEFHGIGTGIANLFINYLADTNLAFTTNPLEARIKIDIHKARIPMNTDCINGIDNIRRNAIAKPLEEAYLQICKENNLSAQIIDAAPWIVGSEICTKRNYNQCLQHCPIEKLCTSCVKEDDKTAELIKYKKGVDGKMYRVETRKHAKQLRLF